MLSPRLEDAENLRRCGWPDCRAACCVYGTWVDTGEMENILVNADRIAPFLPADRREPERWFSEASEPDDHTPRGTVFHTAVLDDPEHYGGTACIFLMGDYRCALQAAGEAAGLHPWHFKPFYCVLHPLDLDGEGRITLDETHLLVDEPASCLVRGDEPVRLAELFEEELVYLSKLENHR